MVVALAAAASQVDSTAGALAEAMAGAAGAGVITGPITLLVIPAAKGPTITVMILTGVVTAMATQGMLTAMAILPTTTVTTGITCAIVILREAGI